MKRKVLLVISILIIIPIMFALYAGIKLNEANHFPSETNVIIPNNSSLTNIVKILNQNNALKPNWLFNFIAKSYSIVFNERYYAGTYKFGPKNTNYSILKAIFSGKQQYVVRLTIPEGFTLKEIASICDKKLGIDSSEFMRLANSDSLLREYNINSSSIEGYLMPLTYDFFYKPQAIEVIRKLLDTQKKLWDSKFEGKAKSASMTKNEVLTLASIIEAETPIADERPIVSGVYHNRLQHNWKLEADPTVQYILGSRKARLRYSDLDINHPYNTYIYHGLPPGPINNPSESSIEAAINPERHGFMFFVAVGDGSGRHYFSRSYAEHLQNKSKYRKNIKGKNN